MSNAFSTKSGCTALAVIVLVAGGCGSGGGGPSEPATSILTTLEVSPSTTALFTRAPGNTVTLSIVARDQSGAPMSVTPTFTSENNAILTVSSNGVVIATTGPSMSMPTTAVVLRCGGRQV